MNDKKTAPAPGRPRTPRETVLPTVSIVVPAYNAARYIGAALESVLAQTFSAWECVVVDDGSRDQTRARAQGYADRDQRVRVVSQHNAGVAAARNEGLGRCSPDVPYILFLDSDDLLEPTALTLLVEVLESNPALSAVHGRARTIDSDGQPDDQGWVTGLRGRQQVDAHGGVRRLERTEPTTYGVLAYRNTVVSPGVLLARRRTLPSDHPFDGAMSPLEDRDLWVQLAINHPIGYLDHVVLAYRHHAESASQDSAKMARAATAFVHKMRTQAAIDHQRQAGVDRCLERQDHVIASRYMSWAAQALRAGHCWRAAMDVRHGLAAYARARYAHRGAL